jgi:hypothetical protein
LTAAASPACRTVAFGDLEAGLWGVMLAGEQTFLAIGGAAETLGVAQPMLQCSGETEDWQISGVGVELVVSGAGEPVSASAPPGFDQLCRVQGRLVLDGSTQDFGCLGVRGARDERGVKQFASLRGVSAWFEPDEGVAVLALRPRKASGHSGDAVTGSVFEPEGTVAVAESRLSTTYGAGELPSRMGLELWIGEEESEQYPRRFAGEAAGPRAVCEQGEIEIQATPLRCHSRGRDGTGVYLLARLG